MIIDQTLVQPIGGERLSKANGPLRARLEKQLSLLKKQIAQQKEVEAKLSLQTEQLSALNQMGQTVTATLDIEVVFERVLTILRPLLGAEGVFILLLEEDELVFAATDEAGEVSLRGLRMPTTAGVAGEVVHTGQAIWISGEEIRQHMSRPFEEVVGHQLGALLAAPLRIQEHWIGVMEAIHSEPDAFNSGDLQLLEAAASWVAIALQNAQLFTQVKISRQRLYTLARKVVTAQEDERLRVSRELHDEAGQALIALKLNLKAIRDSLQLELLETTRERLMEAITLTDQTMEQIRLIAHNLRPRVIDSFSLNEVFEQVCREFTKHTQLSIQYEGIDLPKLQDPATNSFYRFLQESLTNVVKHAGATKAQVVLGQSKELIYLSVTDNGQGISGKGNIPSCQHPNGVGMMGMQERFELLGGWIEIHTKEGQGTQVTAYIPFDFK